MIRTLLLYDGKMSSAERVAEQLSYLIGNAKAADVEDAPEDLTPYGGFCFVFNFYGTVTAGRMRNYLKENSAKMADARLAMVGIGYSDLGYTKYVVDTEQETGLKDIAAIFVSSEKETTRAGYEISKIMRLPAKPMEEEAIMNAIRGYVGEKGTLALATSTSGFIRCTPLKYQFLDDVFYIVTEGGMKFRGILDNGRVCAAIYTSDEEGGIMKSLQFLGDAQTVEVGSAEYKVAMTARLITEEELERRPSTLFLIRITPLRYEFMNRDFEEMGFDANQSLDTRQQKKNRQEGYKRVVTETQKGQPTMTIRDENGEERQVTIPEVGISFLQPFDPTDKVLFSTPGAQMATLQGAGSPAEAGDAAPKEKKELTEEEKQRRRELLARKRRKKELLREKKRQEELEALRRAVEKQEAQDAVTTADTPPEAEKPAAEKKQKEKGVRRSVFARLGDGLGKMLQLEDDEEDDG